MKIIYIMVNSAYPDEIPKSAAFHPGLHCLPKYKIFPVYKVQNGEGFLYTKGQSN